jgi:hypothetical protein
MEKSYSLAESVPFCSTSSNAKTDILIKSSPTLVATSAGVQNLSFMAAIVGIIQEIQVGIGGLVEARYLDIDSAVDAKQSQYQH